MAKKIKRVYMAKKILYQTELLEVRRAAGMGRGVFARKDIRKGTVIESAPIIEISEKDWKVIDQTQLRNYLYGYDKKRFAAAHALGVASLFNHSDDPQATYKVLKEERLIKVWLMKDVKRGEQIFIDYGYDPTT
jgi:SET domain-containing protein